MLLPGAEFHMQQLGRAVFRRLLGLSNGGLLAWVCGVRSQMRAIVLCVRKKACCSQFGPKLHQYSLELRSGFLLGLWSGDADAATSLMSRRRSFFCASVTTLAHLRTDHVLQKLPLGSSASRMLLLRPL